MVDSNILDKIAGLLQLAEKNNNVHESAAAASAAQALLTKHRLTMADLGERDSEKKEKVEVANEPLTAGNKKVAWRATLASVVARTNGCRLYYFTKPDSYSSGTYRRKNIVSTMIVGRDSDIQIVRYFYAYLTEEIERLTKAHVEAGVLFGKSDCNSFKLGAMQAVVSRLQEGHEASRAEAKKELGGSQAIVRLDNYELEVDKFYQGLNLKRGKAQTSRISSAEAFNQGQQAGRKISLNKGIGGKSISRLKD